ncbi:MAG: sigma-70 family RNA polymerase sigma factor [Planctomycetota bacterium]|nr:MAG: sigma-70 family RNA polymerase sigma factor [Planctomycetota bacterium]
MPLRAVRARGRCDPTCSAARLRAARTRRRIHGPGSHPGVPCPFSAAHRTTERRNPQSRRAALRSLRIVQDGRMAGANSAQPLEDLFERYRRDGELDALGRVYDQASPQLHALARRLAPSRSDAEDLVQATFLTAIERADAYDASRKLLPWLLGILAHHALSARRSRGRKPDPERLAARGVEDPADATEAREITEAARAALAELPPRYRAVLEPVLLDDERAIDVAVRRGSSAGVVRMQVHRGLALLRKALPASAALSALVFAGRSRALEAQRRIVLDAARRHALERGAPAVRELARDASRDVARAPRAPLLAWRWSFVTSTLLVVAALWWGATAWSRAHSPGAVEIERPIAALPAQATPPSELASARTELAVDAPFDAALDAAVDAPAAAPTRPTAPMLTAELRWADGTPAALVEVVVQRLDSPDVNRYAMRGVSNARGRIAFRNCGGRLSVRPDRGPAIAVEVAPDEQRVLPIELPRGIDVAVRVVDAQGAPVADAAIGFSVLHHFLFGAPIASTDADGRAALRDVPKGRRLVAWKRGLVCTAAGTVGRGGDADAEAEPRADVELVLVEATAGLRGIVRDSSGQPVARAEVRVGPDPLPRDRNQVDAVAWRTRTDQHGEYEFAAVPVGAVELRVRSGADAPWFEVLELRAGEPSVHDVRLARGAAIRGTLRSRNPTSAAVAEEDSLAAWVIVGVPGTFDCIEVQARVGERFEVTGLAPGSVRLSASGPLGVVSVDGVELAAGQVLERDLWLDSKYELAGRLVERGTARPLEGWHIVAQLSDGGRAGYSRTDAVGAFTLTGVGVDRVHLRVHKPGLREAAPTLVLRDVVVGSRDVLIEIEPADAR